MPDVSKTRCPLRKRGERTAKAMKSSRNNKKAGSALLMVVGLLTILGMLGGTFLLVASLHRRASASLLRIRPLDSLAAGLVSQIADLLGKDKYIGQIPDTAVHRPFAAAGPTGMYADSDATDALFSNAGAALFQGVAQGAQVDTDGNGTPDAYLYPTGVFNVDGAEIYAAVKVMDLSSRICVNTAYDKIAAAAVTPPVSPIRIGLRELVGDAAFTALHTERSGTGGSGVQAFKDGCAMVLSTASGAGYELFSIEDELFLRWLRPGAATNTGRLHTALGGFAGQSLLTTTARSRSILRNPEVYSDKLFRYRLLISSLDVLDGADDTDNHKKRMWLLNELYKALGLDVDKEGESTTNDNPATIGGWWIEDYIGCPGYGGNFHSVDTANPGSAVATWTFPDLTAGEKYKVAVTWTTDSNPDNRPSDAPYTIKDGAAVLATVDVYQKTPGTDFEDEGVWWKILGTYTIDSGTLVVELSNDADSYVSADAVRAIEVIDASEPEDPVPPEDIIIDDQGARANGQLVGNWVTSSIHPNAWAGTSSNDQAINKGVSTFIFTPTIPVPGSYKVYMWWPTNDYWMMGSGVPVDIYRSGGTDSTTVDQTANGGVWNLLGQYSFDEGNIGKVVIRTDGTTGFFVFADAVKFEFAGAIVAVQPKHVEHFVANLWAYMSTLDPKTNSFRVANAYGIVPQLVITEAYAYSVTETPIGGDHGWAYAIELMNPTSVDVDASNYSLIGNGSWDFGGQISNAGVVPPGGRIVLYDFGGKIGPWETGVPRTTDAQASDFFDMIGGAQWIEPTAPDKGKLDFAAANAASEAQFIRIVRVVDGENIPVDSVSGLEEINYTVTNKQTGAGGSADPGTPDVSVGQRDDDASRGRALVAVMKKTTLAESTRKSGHNLGDANGLNAGDIDAQVVYDGFFLRNLGQTNSPAMGDGDTANLGKLINRYILGPSTGTDQAGDLPHQLVDEMASFIRGRIDHNCIPPGVPQGYPAVPWPNVLGELLELVTPHTASSLIYGRININTAPENVLAQLPWPSVVSYGSVTYDVTPADINGSTNNNRITKQIVDNRPYYTPGNVAAVLSAWVDGVKLNPTAKKSAGYIEARYALYNAISNVITTNSDTFAVHIRTQIGSNPKAGAHYYVAVIDRSNCTNSNDRPQVKMLAQIK